MARAAPEKGEAAAELSELERRLLNDFQRDFPLSERPYAEIAERLGVTEEEVIEGLRRLGERGMVSRVGPVFRPHRVGVSTLAAMAVPPPRLAEVAALVSAYSEVNHNYEREHRFNLWFVATAGSEEQLGRLLQDIERRSGIPVLSLPMLDDYHIDLGFELKW
jgi:siroheme decarboxylase